MTLWTMSGAELAAACAPVAHAYPRASQALASVLTDITRLSAADQAQLASAFRKTKTPRQIARRSTFAGWADFAPAYTIAREACAEAVGTRWYLDPVAALKARLPPAWVACRVVGRTSVSPRDVTMPRAPFWVGGALPSGPDYAEFGPIDQEGDVRRVYARQRSVRARGPAFVLDFCPEILAAD